jgi:hypothetical protein
MQEGSKQTENNRWPGNGKVDAAIDVDDNLTWIDVLQN